MLREPPVVRREERVIREDPLRFSTVSVIKRPTTADHGEDPADELQVDTDRSRSTASARMSPSAMRKYSRQCPCRGLSFSVRRPFGMTAQADTTNA